jgi:hypothetical protein
MVNHFKKVFILGGLLVGAAVVGYAMSKEGQELTKKIKEDLEPLAKHMKKHCSRFREDAKEDFEELADTLVEAYAKKKKLSMEAKDAFISALKTKWQDVEREHLNKDYYM